MKIYKVLIKAYSTIVVKGAKSEEEAMELACDEARFGDFEMDEACIEADLSNESEITVRRAVFHARKEIQA